MASRRLINRAKRLIDAGVHLPLLVAVLGGKASLFAGALSFGAAGASPLSLDFQNQKFFEPEPILGAELVTNGDFDGNIDGWSVGGTLGAGDVVEYDGTDLVITRTTNNVTAYQAISCTIGEIYSVTVVAGSGIRTYVSTDTTASTTGSAGSVTFYFTATATTHYVHVRNGVAGGSTWTVQSVSVKHLINQRPSRQSSIYDIAPDLERTGTSTTVDSDGSIVATPQNRFAYTTFGLINSTAWLENPSGTTTTSVVDGGLVMSQNGTNTTGASIYWQGAGATTIDVGAGELHTIIFDIEQYSGNHDWVYVLFWDGSSQNGQRIWLDLENQVEGTQDSSGSTITLDSYDVTFLGDGKARVTMTAYRAGTGNIFPLVAMVDANETVKDTPGQTLTGSIRISNPACFRAPMQKVPEALRTAGASDYFLANTDAGERHLARTQHHLYDGSSWANQRCAISQAVTNGVGVSKPNATDWAETNVTATDDGASGNGLTGALVTADGTNAVHRIRETTNAVTGNQCLWALLSKSDTSSPYVQIYHDKDATHYQNFNTSTGAVETGGAGALNPLALDMGDSWLFSVAFNITTGGDIMISLQDSGSAAWNASNTSDKTMGILHTQVNPGLIPLPLVHTYGAAVTHVADTFPIPAAQVPTYSTQLSLAMSGEMAYSDNGAVTEIAFAHAQDGTDAIELRMSTFAADTGQIFAVHTVNGSSHSSGSAADAYAPGLQVAFNVAGRWSDTDVSYGADGVADDVDSAPTGMPDVSAADLDIAQTLTGVLYLKELQGNPSPDITDTDLETVTT